MSVAESLIEHFSSFAELQAAHDALLARRDQPADITEGLADFWVAVDVFLQRAKATGAVLDITRDRRAAQSILDYWANTLYRAQQPVPSARLAEFNPALAPELPDEPSPYQGLAAFEENDAEFFFGRERLVQTMIDRLRSGERLLAVVGSSGSGKSSLVLAGLLPALRQGTLPGSEQWCIISLVPSSKPLDNLGHAVLPPAKAFDDFDPVDKAKFVFAMDGFGRESTYLANLLALRCPQPIVLVVDQFEELFTLCDDEQARQVFVKQLLGLLEAPKPHVVVLTLRTDFVDNVVRLADLWPHFRRARIDVDALDINELRATIEQPAVRIGLRFDEGIVDDLISTILGERAGLPLLQFTLLRLWQNRQRNRITRMVYAQIGNPRQALERSAEDFYTRLIPEEQRTVRQLLLRLVRPGEGREFTSRRSRVEDLFQDGEARDRMVRVLDRLVNQVRLLKVTGMPPMEIRRSFETATGAAFPDAQVEVAHEALVRNWPRLSDWLDEEREQLRQRLLLRRTAEEWERLDKNKDALLRGTLLEEAKRYRDLNELEDEFVTASEDQVRVERDAEVARQVELARTQAQAQLEAEQSRRKSRVIRRLALVVIGFVFLLVIWGWNEWRWRTSEWQPLSSFPRADVATLAFVPANTTHELPVYCAGTLTIGVGCSHDGVGWNIYQQGLPVGNETPGGVEYYLGETMGINKLAINPSNPQQLLAFAWDGLVYESTNSGVTWRPSGLKLPSRVSINALAISNELMLAVTHEFNTDDRQLYAGNNGTQRWEPITETETVEFNKVYDILIMQDGAHAYIATDTGLLESSLPVSLTLQKVVDLPPVHLIDGAPDGSSLYLVTFDEQQNEGALYHWQPLQGLKEIAKIPIRPRALAVDPFADNLTTVFLLLNNEEVIAISPQGEIKSLGKQPVRLSNIISGLLQGHYWRLFIPGLAYDLLVVTEPSNQQVRLLMGHSDGLLEYRGPGLQASGILATLQ